MKSREISAKIIAFLSSLRLKRANSTHRAMANLARNTFVDDKRSTQMVGAQMTINESE
jgi:hypothetical protein